VSRDHVGNQSYTANGISGSFTFRVSDYRVVECSGQLARDWLIGLRLDDALEAVEAAGYDPDPHPVVRFEE